MHATGGSLMAVTTSARAALPHDCWYAMALSSAVQQTPFAIPFEAGELVATRNDQGTVVVRRARCAHRGCSLSRGWIDNGHLTCPYHGWKYDDTGQCVQIPSLRAEEAIPARARVESLPTQEAHGLVWVWIAGEHHQPTASVDEIPELQLPGMTHQPGADLSYTFQTHFSRSIENGIDPTHAPFTHGGSIGKVDQTINLVFPSYEVQETERTLFARMPIKVKKLRGIAKWLLRGDAEDIYKAYRFIYPNLLLSLVNFGRFTLVSLQAHVPTGPDSTLMLSTNSRNFLRRRPLLTSWFNGVTIKTGNKIALEDDLIIRHQRPSAVTYRGSNEILVESDRILVRFRTMMQRRMSQSQTSDHQHS
jgi:phenylpropionate dioxygenase-like ring-hydroxylating dioxygenase large terminal subunit